MNTGTSTLGTIMNSTALQQQQRVQEQQVQQSKPQEIALPEDSSINDMDLSVAYEVKLATQVDKAYTQPQAAEKKAGAPQQAPQQAPVAPVESATSETSTAAAAADSTEETTTTTTSSDSSANLARLTEQQMQKLVAQGAITKTQMQGELERRNGADQKIADAADAVLQEWAVSQ